MKIEKVNDHQIRCTLTKADLADRQLKLSELAYGTEKAKDLFRDMMHQANLKFGFEAEDIPLMIEAIPLSGDCIVLIITKVEDPEELDTRFSKFAPSLQDLDDSMEETLSDLGDTADEILDLFKKVKESTFAKHLEELSPLEELPSDSPNIAVPSQTSSDNKENKEIVEKPTNITKLVSFTDLETLCDLAPMLTAFYQGKNSLYKDTNSRIYYLVISQTGHSPEDFNRLCNILSEHGQPERFSSSREAYMQEHFKVIIKDNALSSLSFLTEESKK
ncbi:MAG: adaptor protein MecA [Lachnospiraceae bacterium]|nr:adaptor protein MecA [Lachnospiraceae bacterium]